MANRVDTNKTEQFIAQSIMSLFPNFTISKSDPFYDVYIRFFTLTALVDILKLVQAQESKLGYENFELPEAEYDLLAKRWFKDRNVGTVTTLDVVLVFDNPKNLITVRSRDEFLINDNYFNPVSDLQIFEVDYTEEESINGVAEFRLTIPLTAAEINSEGVFSSGDVVTIPYINSRGFLRAYVGGNIEIGADTETNQELFQRLTQTIGTDNWVNTRSIAVNFFTLLRGVIQDYQVIGHGDPEMYRDQLSSFIPKRLMRLTFLEKSNFSLIQKDPQGNLITTVWFNKDSNIRYTIKEDIIKTTTDFWNEDILGRFYIDVDLVLISSANPFGYVEDMECEIKQNVVDTVTKEIVNVTNFYHPNMVSANSKTASANPFTTNIHTGGFMDIYVNSNIVRTERKIYMPVNSNGRIAIPSDLRPILKINKILDDAGLEVDIWSLVSNDAKKRFTIEDDSYIFVNPAYEARELTIDLFHMPSLQLIDATVNDDATRLIQANVKVKTKIPVFVNALVEVELLGNEDFVLLSLLRSTFNSYINNLINTKDLSILKILGVLESELAGRVIIKSFSAEARQCMPDGEEIYLSGDSEISLVEDLSQGVSARTAKFIPENIEFILV